MYEIDLAKEEHLPTVYICSDTKDDVRVMIGLCMKLTLRKRQACAVYVCWNMQKDMRGKIRHA